MNRYISDLLKRWDLHPYTWNLILVCGTLFTGLLVYLILNLYKKKEQPGSSSQSKTDFKLFQSLIKHLSAPVSFWIPIFIFDLLLPVVQARNLIKSRIEHGLEVALIIASAWIFIRLLRVGEDIVHNKVNIDRSDNLRQRRLLTQLLYLRRVILVVIILIATGAVLLTFDTMRKVGSGLLAGVGIGGIIIGFAAQRSLGNLLAGFQIAFTQPIRIDDEVVVEGEFGVIEEITLTYVVVKLWDERRLVLPINHFIEKPFQNWTRNNSQMLGSVFVYTDYSLPVDWLRLEFMKIIDYSPLWDKRSASLMVTNLKDNVMEIRAVVSGKNSGDVFNLRCHLREEFAKLINQYYPQCLPKTRAVLERNTDGEQSV